ncbi:importin-4-like [Drosophila bipectinata]|uniref:importin-4-like n=1 Tax=Drosophila bipectinata TaxID=42026 RepID=UPI0038B31F12
MPPLLQILEEAMAHHDLIRRRAVFPSLAVMAEGCVAAMVNRFLEPMLNTIKNSINCPSALVRNAAFIALGHWSPRYRWAVPRIFYALDTFIKHLKDEEKPHLALLMERLSDALVVQTGPRLCKLVLSTIALNRLKSIEILATIARFVGKERFIPLANDTMLFGLSIIEHKAEDKDLRMHAYNLMRAITIVANEEMEMRESSELDESQAEDDDLIEKEQAIPSFNCVLKEVDNPYDSIRKAALEALSQFMIALLKIRDAGGVACASLMVVPKLAEVARNDQEQSVSKIALEALGEVFRKVKGAVVHTAELQGVICELINDLMTNDVEGENLVIEHAAQLLSLLGLVLEPEEFSEYFTRLRLQYMQHFPKDPSATDNCYIIYGALADCLQSLGTWIVQYFDHLCSLCIQGNTHSDAHTREKAYYRVGELVRHFERTSFASYPIILQVLANAIATERNPPALDHIKAALARLLITHIEGVPLGEVLPVFMWYLPLREETVPMRISHLIRLSSKSSRMPSPRRGTPLPWTILKQLSPGY